MYNLNKINNMYKLCQIRDKAISEKIHVLPNFYKLKVRFLPLPPPKKKVGKEKCKHTFIFIFIFIFTTNKN